MKVAIVGAGVIGSALYDILKAKGYGPNNLSLWDKFPKDNANLLTDPYKDLEGADLVVAATPFESCLEYASYCYDTGKVYLDFTEDVGVREEIRKLAERAVNTCNAESLPLFIPNCGLAPGLVNIIGAGYAESEKFESVKKLQLRVGALHETAHAPWFYSRSWSADGLANELVKPCEILREKEIVEVPACGGLERVILGGYTLEAFHTSGGAGTLPETYEGKIDTLDYKTLRHAGHHKALFEAECSVHGMSKLDGMRKVVKMIPFDVSLGIVFLNVRAVGFDKNGELIEDGIAYIFRGAKFLSAIQLTTAVGAAVWIENIQVNNLHNHMKQNKVAYLKQEEFDQGEFKRIFGIYINTLTSAY